MILPHTLFQTTLYLPFKTHFPVQFRPPQKMYPLHLSGSDSTQLMIQSERIVYLLERILSFFSVCCANGNLTLRAMKIRSASPRFAHPARRCCPLRKRTTSGRCTSIVDAPVWIDFNFHSCRAVTHLLVKVRSRCLLCLNDN